MPKKPTMIYQFKITLAGVKPPIWRRIQVPESYTFWDLHVAIQDAMGWLDCHLHQFEVINPKYGLVILSAFQMRSGALIVSQLGGRLLSSDIFLLLIQDQFIFMILETDGSIK